MNPYSGKINKPAVSSNEELILLDSAVDAGIEAQRNLHVSAGILGKIDGYDSPIVDIQIECAQRVIYLLRWISPGSCLRICLALMDDFMPIFRQLNPRNRTVAKALNAVRHNLTGAFLLKTSIVLRDFKSEPCATYIKTLRLLMLSFQYTDTLDGLVSEPAKIWPSNEVLYAGPRRMQYYHCIRGIFRTWCITAKLRPDLVGDMFPNLPELLLPAEVEGAKLKMFINLIRQELSKEP